MSAAFLTTHQRRSLRAQLREVRDARVYRRTLAVRHISGHRLVALMEIVSPANKDRASHLEEFAAKAVSALDLGVHLLVVDLFPPGPQDLYGIHGVIRQRLEQSSVSQSE